MTAIFPVLPGLGWSVTKTPRFAGRIQHAVSGREVRVLDQPYPIWTWTLTYALLRDKWDTRGAGGLGAGHDELRTIAGFFLARQGTFQTFLFDDPTDNTVAAQVIGTGNSITTTFQLVRGMGGFAEPMTAPNAVSAIRFNGVHQDPAGYTVDGETGRVTFTAAPPSGQIITADFTYRFRVRFADDSAEFENFMYQLWQLKQIKLQSVLR
jgi:uncharacterized protein (TIGR02217 family)